MAVALPDLAADEFARGIAAVSPEVLPAPVVAALFAHYQELRRWSGRLSLVGPGTAREVLQRHFGESLAALPLLPPGPARLVDLGSGAGFPGLVLAAARPTWEVVLVEARERKWAFLQAVARRGGLACRCLNARVAALLPPGFPDAYEVVTVRALSLPAPVLAALASRLAPGGRLLFWAGTADPELPAGLRQVRSVPLPGAEVRRLVVVEPG
jgi:16S rRNA (guanine527-N7)-methyltransferase